MPNRSTDPTAYMATAAACRRRGRAAMTRPIRSNGRITLCSAVGEAGLPGPGSSNASAVPRHYGGDLSQDEHGDARTQTMSDRAIADHALLSDCRSAALVTSGGSIDWLCFPRFDSPSVFARLLDDDAGHWSIEPAARGPIETSRRYLPGTMVLETTFRTPIGTAVLEDAMAIGSRDPGHAIGRGAPGILIRRVTCTDGEMDLQMEYSPRPEYGLIAPFLTVEADGVRARGGASVLMLSSTPSPEMEDADARAR